MVWLQALVASKGAQFSTARIYGDLHAQEHALLNMHGADFIVNATGLSGRELAADKTVYPLRGALIRLINDGSRFPVVSEALVVAHNHEKRDEDGGIVFIVPRNDQTLILGGKCTSSHLARVFHSATSRHRSAKRAQTGPHT